MANELVEYEEKSIMTADDVMDQVKLIQDIMKKAMISGEHYGTIPGCGDKPALLKPGAEKLNLTFRMAPKPEVETIDLGRGHREYRVTCAMTSIRTGRFLGAGVGSASTMETKWRFRKAEQKCPKCGKETIIKGKKEYGGGWLCYGKKGGCGAKFKDGDSEIENQNMGRIEHDNPADYYNTCLKMGKKRALVDAVLTVTAASDIFTQDIEEMVENGVVDITPGQSPQEEKPPEEEQKQITPEQSALYLKEVIKHLDGYKNLFEIRNGYKKHFHEWQSNLLASDLVKLTEYKDNLKKKFEG